MSKLLEGLREEQRHYTSWTDPESREKYARIKAIADYIESLEDFVSDHYDDSEKYFNNLYEKWYKTVNEKYE